MKSLGGFDEIIGHEQIIEHFQNAILLDKMSHGYILNGEENSGKSMLASAFAKTLQCEKKDSNPCGVCKSCRQVETRNHPDIIWITHEKPNSIGVDDLREQLISDIYIKPYSSPYKIYIIDEAEKMTVQAQNSLLKTIEEPPEYGIILLLTNNAEGFLPTILSRCAVLNLRPVKDLQIKKYLMEQYKVPDYKADICVAFAQGNLGKALKLASSERFDEIKEQVVKLLRQISTMEHSALLSHVKEMEKDKQDIYEYLDLMLVWYRDVLLFKVTKDINSLVFRGEYTSISKIATTSSYEGLEIIIGAIEKARVRLKANVNFGLAIELLLLTIKEN